jgi:hypothetical protein
MDSNPVNGNGAYPDEMQEALVFMDALRAAVPTEPAPRQRGELVPRLAATARASTLENETRVMRRGTATAADPVRWPRSRRALLARVAIAIALIPFVLAGLAFAGVTVPSPARSAFDSVGIKLPNQPSKHSGQASSEQGKQPASAQGTETQGAAAPNADGSTQSTAPDKGKSKTAHEHARQQHDKANGKAVGHDQGKAVGLNDAAPPGQTGETGPPAHSNAGGNSDNAHANHPPKGVANGHQKTPPGHTKTPPGHAKTPPGQAKGQTKIPPGQAKK